MIFVQFMESVPSLDAVNDALGCLCLRWAAADGGESKTDGVRMESKNGRIAAREWVRGISAGSILSTVYVVQANFSVHLFTTL